MPLDEKELSEVTLYRALIVSKFLIPNSSCLPNLAGPGARVGRHRGPPGGVRRGGLPQQRRAHHRRARPLLLPLPRLRRHGLDHAHPEGAPRAPPPRTGC